MSQLNNAVLPDPSVVGMRCARMRCAVLAALVLASTLFAPAREAGSDSNPPDLTELPLEALMNIELPKVYGASKFEQKTTEAPASISVVSSDEIKKYGHRTLGDVLQSVQGFHVSYDRNYSFLGTRGINLGDFNSRVLLLVNGHRVNNNLTDGAFVDTAFILDVDLIDHVEVIRGPGSVLYGNNAFFGVINVVTRTGRQFNGAEASAEYAEFDTYKGRVTAGKRFTNGLEVVASASIYDSDGPEKLFYKEFNTPAQKNGIARNLDDDRFGSFFGSVSYQDFTLEGAYIEREKGNPTAQFGTTFGDPRLRTQDKRAYAAFKFAHSFPEIVDVNAQVYYDRNELEIVYPVLPSVFKEVQSGEWWGMELQFTKRLWERHVVTFGAEFRDDFHQSDRISDQDSGQVFTDINKRRESHGVYLQGDFAVLTNLHLNAGVRYDQYGDFDPSFNPRVALIYNPVKSATLKALYGTAFRAPNFLELGDSRFQQVQPEEITSGELVYEQEIGQHLRTSVSGFYNQMDDLIVLENGNFTNLDADAMGLEFALTGLWTNNIRTRVSYTVQRVEDRSGDRDLPDSPEQLVKVNLSVPLLKDKIFAGIEYQYTSSRHTLFTTSTGQTLPGMDADGFGVVNLTLFSQNLVPNLEISASVYNLFDQKYSDPGSRFHIQDRLERDGRTFRCKLTYRF